MLQGRLCSLAPAHRRFLLRDRRDPHFPRDCCFPPDPRAFPGQAYSPDQPVPLPEVYFPPPELPLLPEAWFPQALPESRQTEPPDLLQVPPHPDPLPPEPPVPPGKWVWRRCTYPYLKGSAPSALRPHIRTYKALT